MDRLAWLRLFMASKGLQAVVLTKPANIAAFFRGAQSFLGFRQEPPGRIALCVTDEGVALLGNRTEVARIAEEELPWLDNVTPYAFNWDEWSITASVEAFLNAKGMDRVGDDTGACGEDIGQALEHTYYPLSDEEVLSIHELGKDVGVTVESVAKGVERGVTEVQVAGDLAGRLVRQGIWPELLVVIADDRVKRLRHSIPKAIRIDRLALLSVTARRRGLYVSATRLVSLGPVDADLRRHQDASNRIEARAILCSKPGQRVGHIVKVMAEGFAGEGFQDEWTKHHHGGPCGFCGRDYKGTEHEPRCLTERQPVAWNPTIQGAKSEDTILTDSSRSVPQVITDTETWAYYEATINGATIRRPSILEK